MNYAKAKKIAAEKAAKQAKLVETEREKYIKRLMNTPEYAALKKEVQAFEEVSCKVDYSMNECGDLISTKSIYLDPIFCRDEDGSADCLVAEEILESCSEVICFRQDDYSRGPADWIMEQCHGSPCIVNERPERNCYAVYCPDLGLKIDEIRSEEHGLALVEQAMRKHGYYPDVGKVSSYGEFFHLTMPPAFVQASDEELAALIRTLGTFHEDDIPF